MVLFNKLKTIFNPQFHLANIENQYYLWKVNMGSGTKAGACCDVKQTAVGKIRETNEHKQGRQ